MCRTRQIGRWFLALAVVSAIVPSYTEAGGGKYDKEKKSFPLNYIYLDLPSGILNEQQALAAGTSSRPDAKQAQNVQVFWKKVSDLLFKVTAGRAKIGSLTEVQDIEKADAVISLTGTVMPFAGGAWAVPGGWKNPGGTLNLYYQDLVQENNADDIVETVVHELCHYFMGLPDEYPRAGGNPLCPVNAPGGLRCLMDNFHNGQWSGKFCTHADHNPSAPGANGFPPFYPDKVNLSCQELVDQFFNGLEIQADPNDVAATQPAQTLTALPTGLKNRLLGKARAEIASIKAKRGNGLFSQADRSRIKGFIVNALVDFFKTAEGNPPTGIGGWAEKLTSDLLLTSIGVPPGLSLIEGFLRTEAVRIGQQIIDPQGKATAIQTGLLNSAVAELKRIGASPTLGPEDVKFIGALSKQAAAGQDTTAPESRDQLQLELQREMAETLLAVANQIDLPGAGARRDSLERILGGLEKSGAIPDRKLGSRFGRRTTVVIEPPVLMGALSTSGIDNAETQGYSSQDDKSNYNDLRKLSLFEFSKLVDRNRINVLTASLFVGDGKQDVRQGLVKAGPTPYDNDNSNSIFDFDKKNGLDAKASGKLDAGLIQDVLDARRSRIATSLDMIKNQIERDQIENIVILVPPGGLPPELGDALVPLRAQYLEKTDLRLDVTLVGSATIPAELRDLVTRTRGSILTVTDIDEVGSVAQRLAGEQTQGTWVTIPQQDMLILDGATPDYKNEIQDGDLTYSLFTRLRKNRNSHKVQTTGSSKVVLKSFYVDPATTYEMIVGLTQPLTIAGLSDAPQDPSTKPADVPAWRKYLSRSDENLKNFPDPVLKLINGEITDRKDIAAREADTQLTAMRAPIKLDLSKSTPTTLVFQLPAGAIATGWYTPVLLLDGGNFHDAVLTAPKVVAAAKKAVGDTADTGARKVIAKSDAAHDYRNKTIHFTFSVGTPTSKAQLVAGLVQDVPKDTASTDQGTIVGNQAVVTAVLSAGAAVTDAEVVGYVQEIDSGTADISSDPVTFHDDGVAPDKQKDDGIYTATISLDARRSKSAEFRVFVEARSVRDKTKFVPAGEPGLLSSGTDGSRAVDAKTNLATQAVDRPAPAFQRATSVNFFVPRNQ